MKTQRPDSPTSWELDWLRRNAEHVSVYGSTSSTVFGSEANTPRVLASAQKVHVLAAFLEQVRGDASLGSVTVPLRALERHDVSGTDAGAYARALMADGFAVDERDRQIPVTSLLTQMLYYSSNAASDAIADLLQARSFPGSTSATLPPRMSAQFRSAYPDGTVSVGRSALVAAGQLTYLNTVRYLADLMADIVQHRHDAPGLDALRFLPRLTTNRGDVIRGKRGRLPGYRAAVFVRVADDAVLSVGAYAFATVDLDDRDEEKIARLEGGLLAAATGRMDLPSVAHEEHQQ